MQNTRTTARALVMIALAVSTLTPTSEAFAGDVLTLVSYGGAAQANERKAVFEPFAKATGIKYAEDEYDGSAVKIRAMVQTRKVSWDVIEIGMAQARILCSEGMIETIDWKKLGTTPANFILEDRTECGAPSATGSTLIGYDKDKLANGPKSVADIFDLKKFPGKRGLQKSPRNNVEWALIADGIPPKDVYKVLRTPEGIDRAFRKLDTIKNDIVWWTAGAQPPQFLADGQVVMTSAYNGRFYDANKNAGKHFEYAWDTQRLGATVWVIPKGSAHLDDAHRFLAFAIKAGPQAEIARGLPYGPTNKDAFALVDPAMLPHLPTAPDNLRRGHWADEAFWTERADELNQRFSSWLAK